MQNNLINIFKTEVVLLKDAVAGVNQLVVDDVTPFKQPSVVGEPYNNIIIYNNKTIARLIPGPNRSESEVIQIDGFIDSDIKQLILKTPLVNNWNVSDVTKIRKAPLGFKVENIIIGDNAVSLKYPSIMIVPKSKNISWTTLSGTTDVIGIDFIIYVKDDDTQQATETLLKLTDVMENILMSNLHVAPMNRRFNSERSNKSMVKTIDYGRIQKGSEFLKAAVLGWTADIYTWRALITQQTQSAGDYATDGIILPELVVEETRIIRG